MPDDDRTIGELFRSLEEFKADARRRFDAIDHRFDQMEFVRLDVYELDRRAISDRVGATEESLRWFRRTLIALALAAVVPLMIAALVANRGA